ncbi:hypothetical protein [Nostoc sp. PCC 7107]|uniref:hypothetical protein n=1 Tax=Nostoc sp. PCC 7107 TaxID=317936 RepID=UPI00029F1E90|nr:hypothetical protein [Nostoc sp. PCC 7107]AFY44097.1 hypothetical protein Nos7107_3528 [Nostoc sp. PCC 7107]
MKKAFFWTQPLFLLGISLVLYIMALSLPALAFEIVEYKTIYTNSITIMKGAEVTMWGVLGLLFLQAPAIGWLANPLYWLSCKFFVQKKYYFSIASAFSAIIVGFTGTISTYWFPLPNGSNPDSQLLLIKLLPGFWLWLAAPAFLMMITSGFVYGKYKNSLENKSVKFP